MKEEVNNISKSSNTGWIAHTGNGLPSTLKPDSLVRVHFRGYSLSSGTVASASSYNWLHKTEFSPGGDIVAYKIVNEEKDMCSKKADWGKGVFDTRCVNSLTQATTTVGVKADGGKPAVTQGALWYFPRALQAVAKQSEFGAKKYNLDYSDKNFLKVEHGVQRYSDGLGRHLLGEVIDKGGVDPETGMLHAYGVAWNALARLEMMLIIEEESVKKD